MVIDQKGNNSVWNRSDMNWLRIGNVWFPAKTRDYLHAWINIKAELKNKSSWVKQRSKFEIQY